MRRVSAIAATTIAACGVLMAFAPAAMASVETVRIDLGEETLLFEETATHEAGSGTVSWNAESQTLTLSNATIESSSSTMPAVYVKGEATKLQPLKIVLKGDNVVKGAGGGTAGLIYTQYCNVTVSGSGSLTAKCTGVAGPALFVGGTGTLSIKSGTINAKSTYPTAIYSAGALKMTGGVVESNAEIRSAKNMSITGGMVSAVAKDDGYAVLSNTKLKINPKVWGSIKGRLGPGASFSKSGATYEVASKDEVTLTKYAGSKKAKVNTVSFGGKSYKVAHIGAGAFHNAKGRKVKQVTIGPNVKIIYKNAFKGTSKLKTMDVTKATFFKLTKSKDNYTYMAAFSNKAFAGCGARNGAGLTVKCGSSLRAHMFASGMPSKGLSKKAKFRV